MSAAGSGKGRPALLAACPDIPRWLETRALLLRPDSRLWVDGSAASPAFAVASARRGGLVSVVGAPAPELIRAAAASAGEALAFPENLDHVAAALPTWTVEGVVVHTLAAPEAMVQPAWPAGFLGPEELAGLTHLPEQLAEELAVPLGEDRPVAVARDQGSPVAFCYPTACTETLWDVSIDTVASHRRRGFAAAAATHLIRHLRRRHDLRPSWSAVESNAASRGLAAALGFVEIDHFWLLTPPQR